MSPTTIAVFLALISCWAAVGIFAGFGGYTGREGVGGALSTAIFVATIILAIGIFGQ